MSEKMWALGIPFLDNTGDNIPIVGNVDVGLVYF